MGAVGIGLVGGAVVLFALYDLFQTVLAAGRGAGPLAGRIARVTWKALRGVARVVSGHGPLAISGPAILIAIVTTWVLLLILGWTLVFGGPDVLGAVDSESAVPLLTRLRYAAGVVIGRGSATVEPAGGLYEVLEPIAALTGLTVLSLSIAYTLAVVQGVVEKRSLALMVSALGRSPGEILTRAWNGRDLGELDLHYIGLVPRVAEVAQAHLAYPVIHYFHSVERDTALGPSIVALDEALTANGLLAEDARVQPTAVEPLRAAVTHFLDTLHLAFIEPAEVEVSAGDERMRATSREVEEAGVPLASDVRRELDEDEVGRNRLLRGYLVHDGWEDADALDVAAGREAATRDAGDAQEREQADDIDGVDRPEDADTSA